MYNVLEKLRAEVKLEVKDKETYDQGLIAILRTIHDRIDAEVAAACSCPVDLPSDDILHRLVTLIRWLRPEYQNPAGHAAIAKGTQTELADTTAKTLPTRSPPFAPLCLTWAKPARTRSPAASPALKPAAFRSCWKA